MSLAGPILGNRLRRMKIREVKDLESKSSGEQLRELALLSLKRRVRGGDAYLLSTASLW